MTCRELTEFLLAFLGDELPEGERTAFEFHLSRCPPCVAYLETYKQTILIGRKACGCDRPHGELPPFPEELVQAILKAKRSAEGAPGAS